MNKINAKEFVSELSQQRAFSAGKQAGLGKLKKGKTPEQAKAQANKIAAKAPRYSSIKAGRAAGRKEDDAAKGKSVKTFVHSSKMKEENEHPHKYASHLNRRISRKAAAAKAIKDREDRAADDEGEGRSFMKALGLKAKKKAEAQTEGSKAYTDQMQTVDDIRGAVKDAVLPKGKNGKRQLGFFKNKVRKAQNEGKTTGADQFATVKRVGSAKLRGTGVENHKRMQRLGKKLDAKNPHIRPGKDVGVSYNAMTSLRAKPAFSALRAKTKDRFSKNEAKKPFAHRDSVEAAAKKRGDINVMSQGANAVGNRTRRMNSVSKIKATIAAREGKPGAVPARQKNFQKYRDRNAQNEASTPASKIPKAKKHLKMYGKFGGQAKKNHREKRDLFKQDPLANKTPGTMARLNIIKKFQGKSRFKNEGYSPDELKTAHDQRKTKLQRTAGKKISAYKQKQPRSKEEFDKYAKAPRLAAHKKLRMRTKKAEKVGSAMRKKAGIHQSFRGNESQDSK